MKRTILATLVAYTLSGAAISATPMDRIENFQQQFRDMTQRVETRFNNLLDRSQLKELNPDVYEKVQESIISIYEDRKNMFLDKLDRYENRKDLTPEELTALDNLRLEIINSEITVPDDDVSNDDVSNDDVSNDDVSNDDVSSDDPIWDWGWGLADPPKQEEMSAYAPWVDTFYNENSKLIYLLGFSTGAPLNPSFDTPSKVLHYVRNEHPELSDYLAEMVYWYGEDRDKLAVANVHTNLATEPPREGNNEYNYPYTQSTLGVVLSTINVPEWNNWAPIYNIRGGWPEGTPTYWDNLKGYGIVAYPMSTFRCETIDSNADYTFSVTVPVDTKVTLMVDIGTIGKVLDEEQIIIDPFLDGSYDSHTEMVDCTQVEVGMKRCETTIKPGMFEQVVRPMPGGLPLGTNMNWRIHSSNYGIDGDAVNERTNTAKGCIVRTVQI